MFPTTQARTSAAGGANPAIDFAQLGAASPSGTNAGNAVGMGQVQGHGQGNVLQTRVAAQGPAAFSSATASTPRNPTGEQAGAGSAGAHSSGQPGSAAVVTLI